MEEIWKDVKGYEGLYQVSSLGKIKSLYNKQNMKPYIHNGYSRITLHKNGQCKMNMVHRLVAQAFIDNPLNKPCVNHIDFNRSNNNVENLEWCTYSENQNHSFKNNRRNNVKYAIGESHGISKLKNDDVMNIRYLLKSTNKSYREIGGIFNVSATSIYKINKGLTWSSQ